MLYVAVSFSPIDNGIKNVTLVNHHVTPYTTHNCCSTDTQDNGRNSLFFRYNNSFVGTVTSTYRNNDAKAVTNIMDTRYWILLNY